MASKTKKPRPTSSSQQIAPVSLSSAPTHLRLPSSSQTELQRLEGANSIKDGNPTSGFGNNAEGKPWARKRKNFKAGRSNAEVNSAPLDIYKAPRFTQHYIIKLAGEGLRKISPIKINNEIVVAIGKPKTLSIVNATTINVCVTSGKQGEALANLKKLGDLPVCVETNSKLNTSQGTIRSPFLSSCTKEELLEALQSEGVVEVSPLVHGRRCNGPSDTYKLTFSTPTTPETVSPCLLLCKLKVRPFIPAPLRCFKCLKFGHQARNCRSPQELCACGLPRHKKDKEPCKSPPSCINCRCPHSSLSRNCLVHQKEMAIQAFMALEKVPYVVARKLYKSSSQRSVSHLSYADKVKKNPPSKSPAQRKLQEVISSNFTSNLAKKMAEKRKATLPQSSKALPQSNQVQRRHSSPETQNRNFNEGTKPCVPAPIPCPASFPSNDPNTSTAPAPSPTTISTLSTLHPLTNASISPAVCDPTPARTLPRTHTPSSAPTPKPSSLPSLNSGSAPTEQIVNGDRVKDVICPSDPPTEVQKVKGTGNVPISTRAEQVDPALSNRWRMVHQRKRRRRNPDSRLRDDLRHEISPLETSDSEDLPVKKKKKKGWPKGKPRKPIAPSLTASQPNKECQLM